MILWTFIEFLKVGLTKAVAIWMTSARLATHGLLKIVVFWKTDYDVVIYVHDVTSKIFSRDSNYIVGMVMGPKIGNSGIEKSYHDLSFIRIWTRKTNFSERF